MKDPMHGGAQPESEVQIDLHVQLLSTIKMAPSGERKLFFLQS